MQITLLNYTELNVCSHAIRTCWQSFEKSDNGGEKDKELIYRVGNKFKHASTLEHLHYTFYIQGISRATLQELARHRIASLSVKSTRYTLKELKNAESFSPFNVENLKRAQEFLVLTHNEAVDKASVKALENLRLLLQENISNDLVKFAMPESYKTELTWSINARSLQNFLSLRSSKSALWEIRNLAFALFESLPEEHKFIFEECMEGKKNQIKLTLQERDKFKAYLEEFVKQVDKCAKTETIKGFNIKDLESKFSSLLKGKYEVKLDVGSGRLKSNVCGIAFTRVDILGNNYANTNKPTNRQGIYIYFDYRYESENKKYYLYLGLGNGTKECEAKNL